MPVNATDEFRLSPILFLHKTPLLLWGAEQPGISVMNLQVITDPDEHNYAHLKPTPHGGYGLLFYVLGWAEQQVSTGILGDVARFFFTGPLTGCVFAVDKNWARPRVIHANQQLNNGQMNVPGMMNSVNHFMVNATSKLKFWKNGPNITVVQSHDRPDETTYNIFGYRSRIGWTFYQQVIDENGPGNRTVRELIELDTWF